jgi:hypothetical protein
MSSLKAFGDSRAAFHVPPRACDVTGSVGARGQLAAKQAGRLADGAERGVLFLSANGISRASSGDDGLLDGSIHRDEVSNDEQNDRVRNR